MRRGGSRWAQRGPRRADLRRAARARSARLPARVLQERRFVADPSATGRRRRGRYLTARSDVQPGALARRVSRAQRQLIAEEDSRSRDQLGVCGELARDLPLGSRSCSSRFSCRDSRKSRKQRSPQSVPINSTKLRSSHRPPHTNESPKSDSMKRDTSSNIPPKNNALYFLIICSPSRAFRSRSRSPCSPQKTRD